MLLVIDVGNTSIAFGLFQKRRLVRHSRLATKKANLKTLVKTLKNPPSPPFNKGGNKNLPPFVKGGKGGFKTVEGVCISSVVPRFDKIMRGAIKKLFGVNPFFVSSKNAGIKIVHYNPKEVGADRLVNAVAAFRKYKKSLIIVDFGTATTFDYVTAMGEYAGGVIAPGIELASSALSHAAAKLPKIAIKKPTRVVGRRTVESMRSGLFYGYAGLVDHIVAKIKKEKKAKPKVIATGGLAPLIAPATKTIKAVHPFLTLEGLRLIWEQNQLNRRHSHDVR